MKTWTVGAALALGGCAVNAGGEVIPEAAAGPCEAQPAQILIGEQATSALGQRAMQLSGAREFRWIPPDSAVTMDYRSGRLNVEYGRRSRVTTICCG